jgi:hypothetical protein
MGYECPVCETPQADARHLANHLAFTAVLGNEAHESWLDEHAPGWSDAGEAELAPRVAEHASEVEFEQVFEDATGGTRTREPLEERSGALFEEGEGLPPSADRGGHGHGHGHSHGHDHGDDGHAHEPRESHLAGGVDPERMDPETREVLEEARDLTREMLADENEGENGDEERTDGEGGDNKA